ncbi:hypothetical protein Tco_0339909 [Tanacetum coccineum]
MDLTLASESRLMQLNELAELRDGAYENTRIYKERTKKWHDSRLRGDKDFKVGDKVLLYNSRLKMYPGKLKSKWSGPNIVKTVYPHGAIEITDRDGFSFKVNGQRLKKYYGGNIDKEDDEVIEFENGVTLSIRRIQTPWIRRIDLLDVIQSLFFSTVDTAYSLNEYSVFDTGINTAYPGHLHNVYDFPEVFQIFLEGLKGSAHAKLWQENDNEKINLPSLPSPEPVISCFDDLDFFKDFENEFSAIVYNDAQTSKSDLLSELILSPQRIDEFDLNGETSLSEYEEEEQNASYFNDLFPFNIIHPDDLKSKKDNNDNEIDIIQSSGDMALPPHDQRHQYLRYEGLQYKDADILDFESRLTRIYRREVYKVHVFNFGGLSDLMTEGLSDRMLMKHRDAQGQSMFTSQAWRRLFDIRGIGAIPSKTAANAKIAIQEMAEYSQKWHNGTSRSRSIETSNGLAAMQAQLNNLGREIKKVNEKVYATQVGCEQCKGPHYTKDCPLKEEGKPSKKLTTSN